MEKDKKITCDSCGMKFDTQAELDAHKRVVHERREIPAGNMPSGQERE